MPTNEDHGAQNPDNPYCVHCTDLKGKLLPLEKKFEEMVQSTMQTRWMTREEAERTVKEQLSEMPAWKGKIQPVSPNPQASAA